MAETVDLDFGRKIWILKQDVLLLIQCRDLTMLTVVCLTYETETVVRCPGEREGAVEFADPFAGPWGSELVPSLCMRDG